MTTTSPRRVAALVALPLLYAAAAWGGRATALPGDISLVWPAAGVGFVWWHAARTGRTRLLTLPGLLLVSWLVTALTGASVAESAVLAAGATVQVVVAAAVYRRYAHPPSLLPSTPEHLWWLVGAAAVGALVSVPATALAAATAGEEWSIGTGALWVVRNCAGVVVVVPLLAAFSRSAGRWFPPSTRRTELRLSVVEHTLMLVLAPLLYVLWFTTLSRLPLAFPLIGLTVWAGARLQARFVVVHNGLMGATALALTIVGVGPFAAVGDETVRVVVASLYVSMVAIIGLALALARADRLRLLAAAEAARDESERRAALLATILDTMEEGVEVVDADRTVILRNRHAAELLGLRAGAGAVLPPGSAGLFHPDGRAVADDELPHRLAERDAVRGVDLLVRNDGVPAGRYVRVNATSLPEGSGVVSTLRDVTAERAEAGQAAQVQNALLPAAAPQVDGYDMAAASLPAGTLGGDFYDWQCTGDGLVLTIADVMGKGTPAALLAAATRTALRAHADVSDSGAALTSTERAVHGDLTRSGAFVTAFRAHVDPASGAVTYADAGHGLGLVVRRDGTVDRLTSARGLPLGIAPDVPRACGTTHLHPGDVLLVVSDGVVDALPGGLDCLPQVADAVHGARDAGAAVDAVLRLTDDAAEGYADDRTVLALVAATGPGRAATDVTP